MKKLLSFILMLVLLTLSVSAVEFVRDGRVVNLDDSNLLSIAGTCNEYYVSPSAGVCRQKYNCNPSGDFCGTCYTKDVSMSFCEGGDSSTSTTTSTTTTSTSSTSLSINDPGWWFLCSDGDCYEDPDGILTGPNICYLNGLLSGGGWETEAECELAGAKPCEDTDGGVNIYKKGTITGSFSTESDHCSSIDDVYEHYCSGLLNKHATYNCGSDFMCQEGACVPRDEQLIVEEYLCVDGTQDGDCSGINVGFECIVYAGQDYLVENPEKCGGVTKSGETADAWVEPPTIEDSEELVDLFWQQELELNEGGECSVPLMVECGDGSQRILSDCVGGVLQPTGQSCPDGAVEKLLGTIGLSTTPESSPALSDGSAPSDDTLICDDPVVCASDEFGGDVSSGVVSVVGMVGFVVSLVLLLWLMHPIFLVPLVISFIWILIKLFGVL